MVRATECYADWLASGDAVVVGDWNSNATVDPTRCMPHTATVAKLGELGMVSAYHHKLRARYAYEPDSTWYNHKRSDRGFHIDYGFIPRAWTRTLHRVTTGACDEWMVDSDHMLRRGFQRWGTAERNVVVGLAGCDLADVYRSLHGYGVSAASWTMRRKGAEWPRRLTWYLRRSVWAQCCVNMCRNGVRQG